MPTQKERDLRLDKTKLKLMMMPDTMFYTTIMFSMIYKWTDELPTMAVDGRHMFVNPKFFDRLSPELLISAFIHEVLHVALDHITRGLNHENPESNYAADYVVNLILKDAGYPLGDGWLLDERFRDMCYEEVYKILIDEKKKNGKSTPPKLAGGGCGISGPSTGKATAIGFDILPPANEAEASEIKAEIADLILRATTQTQQAGGYGSIPGAVIVELDKTLNPKLPWNVIFQNYMHAFAKDDYTWRRPNRRYLPDLIMPSAYSEAICNVVLAVDSSGSVSDKEFGFFIQEVDVIQQELHPEKITLIDFDTHIRKIHEITQNTDVLNDIEFTGRGGTNVHPVLEWACENEPEVLVIFTDGDFRNPSADKYPNCPVLWLIHNEPRFVSEMGEVIHYEL